MKNVPPIFSAITRRSTTGIITGIRSRSINFVIFSCIFLYTENNWFIFHLYRLNDVQILEKYIYYIKNYFYSQSFVTTYNFKNSPVFSLTNNIKKSIRWRYKKMTKQKWQNTWIPLENRREKSALDVWFEVIWNSDPKSEPTGFTKHRNLTIFLRWFSNYFEPRLSRGSIFLGYVRSNPCHFRINGSLIASIRFNGQWHSNFADLTNSVQLSKNINHLAGTIRLRISMDDLSYWEIYKAIIARGSRSFFRILHLMKFHDESSALKRSRSVRVCPAFRMKFESSKRRDGKNIVSFLCCSRYYDSLKKRKRKKKWRKLFVESLLKIKRETRYKRKDGGEQILARQRVLERKQWKCRDTAKRITNSPVSCFPPTRSFIPLSFHFVAPK